MRRVTPLVAIALVLLAVACGTKAQTHESAQDVANVRESVAAVEAYHSDNNTWAGMTVAKLRAIDPGLADISVARASMRTYCIESTTGDSHAFKNGPAAKIMLGSCSDPKNGKPYNPPSSNTSASSKGVLNPRSSLRAAIPTIEAYYIDHNTYAGMTVSKLRRKYDWELPAIRIVSAKKGTYCIEISVDGSSAFKRGPVGDIQNGACPT